MLHLSLWIARTTIFVLLEREQETFYLKSASKSRQRTVGTNRTMTRNDDRYGIASIGGSDSTRSVSNTDLPRNLAFGRMES